MKIKEVKVSNRAMPRNGSGQSRDWKRYDSAPRIYVSVEGENIFDNLSNRTARPSRLYAQAVAPALAALGLSKDQFRAGWSQCAGCTCPCSPGFVVKPKPGAMLPNLRKDVWVTVTGDDAHVDPKKAPRTLNIPTSQGMAQPTNVQELIGVLLNP